MTTDDYNQWATIKPLITSATSPSWIPLSDKDRVGSYIKYDQMYWNDRRQYALRVLEGEEPLYIPNARTIVDTTAHYLLKGLELTCDNTNTMDVLKAFLKREAFYSRFHTSKQAGVARGDFIFHMTANPFKADGSRISLNTVEPHSVFPIWSTDTAGKMVGCHLAMEYYTPDEPNKLRVRALTYRLVEVADKRTVTREEAIYETDTDWFGPEAVKFQQVIPLGSLDALITAIPVYWFKNRHWDGEDFGSSELRGLEAMAQTVSQGSTDVSASLALEGLGVYATDGGRPVGEDGAETDWEVAPGRVMEVPSGSYFRRVEGVGSITPATDQITYLEDRMHQASGIAGVAMGDIDAMSASSGIALAIKFIPTLAKIETRDQAGMDILTQMFYDWKTWHGVFEKSPLEGDIVPVIGDKLPTDRVAKVNELNNMMDRKVISAAYYRKEMTKLGYEFPSDSEMEKQVRTDIVNTTPVPVAPVIDPNAPAGPQDGTAGNTLQVTNRSNNRNRPNESAGTEANSKAASK